MNIELIIILVIIAILIKLLFKKRRAPKESASFSSNKSIVLTIERNVVQIRDQFGQVYGTILPVNGKPVFAEYNSSLDMALITTDKGYVDLYKLPNGFKSTRNHKAVMAQWMGNDIIVKIQNGDQYIYDKNWNFKRVIYMRRI